MTVNDDRQTARRYIGGETRRTVLPGGLRVLSEDMPGSHTFSLGFFVGTGSRHESAHLHGASHFLEHVLFKGTKRRTPEQISAAIEEVGGEINAYTAKEHTCFYAKVLADDAPVAVDVISDMLSASTVQRHELEAERDVILDEIAMHNDDPVETAHELVANNLFTGTTLARSVIGTESSIRGLTREQVVGYYKRHYDSSNIVVTAAGHVDHDRLVDSLRELDERLARRSQPTRTPPARLSADPGVLAHKRPFEQANAVMAFGGPGVFRAPGEIDERRYALNLLAAILGGGMSSRLFVEVRERRALTYAIDASEAAYADVGMFTVEWGSSPERVPDIAGVVRATVADVIEHGVAEHELRRAHGQMRGQMMLGYEGPTARMSRLGTAEMIGDTRTITEILDRYAAVTADEIQAVAADVLSPAPVLAVVGAGVNRSRLRRLISGWDA
ncbi:pitrilysin family protein [Mariniluteicoccus endophyticus]